MTAGHEPPSFAGRKRRRLRESPLLQPLARRPLASAALPQRNAPRRTAKGIRLSPRTRQRWLLDAKEVLDSTTVSLDLQSALLDTPQHQRSLDVSRIDQDVSVAAREDTAMATLAGFSDSTQSSQPSSKTAPVCCPEYASLPLYARRDGNQSSPTKPPHRINPKPTPARLPRLSISSLVSQEMLAKLQAHLEDKIRGDFWTNEIRSRLARPLSATVFSNRQDQLSHDLTAPQFCTASSRTSSYTNYPYNAEAHDSSSRISRMYRKRCYRRDILTSVRRLAVAIRYFRRVINPWLIRAHRRRRRAAVRIQRKLRHHFHWKLHVLRPFVVKFVAYVTRISCVRVNARVELTTKLRRLVRERKEREVHACERRRVLYRWVAKTRVCLFVHKVWCVKWFCSKRENSLLRLRDELQQLEASDAAVHAEYSTIFATAFGRKLLKRELAAWRLSVKTAMASGSIRAAVDTSSPPTSDVAVRLRQCFAIFDLDGSGTLDLDEFELMLSYLRTSLANAAKAGETKQAKLTTAQVRDLFESLDADGSGTVTCIEFEQWWTSQRGADSGDIASGSASVSLLSTGLGTLILTGHGLLFWLLGKKQQLERKFVKKLLVKKAQDSAKRALLAMLQGDATAAGDDAKRCKACARRFGLQRDLNDHSKYQCQASEWAVDTYLWKKWIREEELRLLDEARDENREEEEEVGDDTDASGRGSARDL